MGSILQAKLFSIKHHEFTIKDFLAVLDFFGLLNNWKKRVGKALAHESFANSNGMRVDEQSIAESSMEFRYEQDLLNVEELNIWLSIRHLSQNDLERF